MSKVRAFIHRSGFFMFILLVMIGLTSVIYLRPAPPGETSAEAFAPAHGVPEPLPVIVYRGVYENGDAKDPLGIPMEDLENDLGQLKANGYTTLDLPDLVSFACEGTKLPEKPVVIAFGEGCLGSYFKALPLFRKYGIKAVGDRRDIESLLPGRRRMPPVRWIFRPQGEALATILKTDADNPSPPQ